MESTDGAVEQPDSALWGIYLCFSIIPVALTVVTCTILMLYDLTEEKLKAAQPSSAAP